MERKVKPWRKFGNLYPLVENFFYRNQVTIAAGGPYAGKSRMSLLLADKLSKGEPTMLGHYEPMRVLYCSERDWDFNSEQLRTVGLEEVNDNLHFFCIPDLPKEEILKFESEPLLYIEHTCITTTWKPDLVILDTAPQFQPSTTGKEVTNSYSFNRRELLKWKRWATKHNLAIFGLYHSPKQNEKSKYADPFDRVLGSTAILASTIAVAVLERANDEELRVHFKSHVGVLETPRTFKYSDFSETTETTTTPKLTDTERDILKAIPTEKTKLADCVIEIIKITKKSRATVYRTIEKLRGQQLVTIEEDRHTNELLIFRVKTN